MMIDDGMAAHDPERGVREGMVFVEESVLCNVMRACHCLFTSVGRLYPGLRCPGLHNPMQGSRCGRSSITV